MHGGDTNKCNDWDNVIPGRLHTKDTWRWIIQSNIFINMVNLIRFLYIFVSLFLLPLLFLTSSLPLLPTFLAISSPLLPYLPILLDSGSFLYNIPWSIFMCSLYNTRPESRWSHSSHPFVPQPCRFSICSFISQFWVVMLFTNTTKVNGIFKDCC